MPKPEARPAETPWGKAIDRLLKVRNMTLGDLSKGLQRERTQVYRWRIKGSKGPTALSLTQVLDVIDATWHDWADAYEAVRNGKPIGLATDKNATHFQKTEKKSLGGHTVDIRADFLLELGKCKNYSEKEAFVNGPGKKMLGPDYDLHEQFIIQELEKAKAKKIRKPKMDRKRSA